MVLEAPPVGASSPDWRGALWVYMGGARPCAAWRPARELLSAYGFDRGRSEVDTRATRASPLVRCALQVWLDFLPDQEYKDSGQINGLLRDIDA